jgi:hypothetical protein
MHLSDRGTYSPASRAARKVPRSAPDADLTPTFSPLTSHLSPFTFYLSLLTAAHPPAMAATTVISSPSCTGVAKPLRNRISSSFR